MLTSHRPRATDPSKSERSSVLARGGMVCTSVPAATAAGCEMLRRGGNAVDAALAAAAVLTVVEPMSCGLGGDAFMLLWPAAEGRLVGLNGSGRAPASASAKAYRDRGLTAVPERGILAATVPGVVHAWETLHSRYGRLPFGDLLEPAIRRARDGFAVSELVAYYWQNLTNRDVFQNDNARATWAPGGQAPAAGTWFQVPALARTLERIAERGAAAFYTGAVADAIVAASDEQGGFFRHADLETHESTWVTPISSTYRGVEVAELPPNGQGLTALIALNILECLGDAAPLGSALEWHRRIEAAKLAFADRDAYIADPEHAEVPVAALLDRAYAAQRARLIGDEAMDAPAPGLAGDTVYLCAADRDGNMVSFIQSLFTEFGSGVGCGETGVLLQARGSGFRLDDGHPNVLAPGKRPFHTIIPGMLLEDGQPRIAFGIMGGHVQPQAHLAFVSNMADYGLHAQEALDRPRFRYQGGRRVAIERPEIPVTEGGRLDAALEARGHEVEVPGEWIEDIFGGGQAVERLPNGVWAGASDRRKDGCAFGLDD